MGPRVQTRWTAWKEVGSLYVRDSTFIKSQIQAFREAIPVKSSWKAYCEESELIMVGLIHDKMYNPRSNPPVTWANLWEAVQKEADPIKVKVAPMRGKRLPRFSTQLMIRKPLALNAITAPSHSPNTHHTEIISLDEELIVSAQETSGARKEKSAYPSFVRSSKAIIPLLTRTGIGSKNGKMKNVSLGEESSLDCYIARYMKPPYTHPNDLSVSEGHLWNKCIEAFHAVRPLLSDEEGRKYPSSDPMDAFSLPALYMIRVFLCLLSLYVSQFSFDLVPCFILIGSQRSICRNSPLGDERAFV
ncbi:hypothetical protein LIER_39109 [Lithospermum erythrorhizon]|uniref:Uncharacterized protein n=1 Tax=Lithospermum erythrorhizon TaxID=34254 RepID=A0AAV3QF59_LITER